MDVTKQVHDLVVAFLSGLDDDQRAALLAEVEGGDKAPKKDNGGGDGNKADAKGKAAALFS